jgi:hypothetical protein
MHFKSQVSLLKASARDEAAAQRPRGQPTKIPRARYPYFSVRREKGWSAAAEDPTRELVRRFQITRDGLRGYIPTIEEYLGADVDFAQLLKV